MKALIVLLASLVMESSLIAANAKVSMEIVLMPAMKSPSWSQAADNLILDLMAGQLKVNSVVTGPTDYSIIRDNRIEWFNLVYSVGGGYTWRGVWNPLAPFNEEYGQVVQQLVTIRSDSGTDDVSLDQLNVKSYSSDADGILEDGLTFMGMNLNRRAFVVRSDGKRVIDGPTSTKGQFCLVITQMKLFTAGNQGQLNLVRDWIMARDLRLSYRARILGSPDSEVQKIVSVSGLPAITNIKIGITHDAGVVRLTVAEDEALQLQSSGSPMGPWSNSGLISRGEPRVMSVSGSAKFFRAVRQ